MKKVTFSVVAALVVVCLSAFAVTSAESAREATVLASDTVAGWMEVRIGSERHAYQGTRITIPITARADSYSIGSFNFLIGWNLKVLDLIDVQPGRSFQKTTGELGRFDLTFTEVELTGVETACDGELLSGFVEISGVEFSKVSDAIQTTRTAGEVIDTLCVLEFLTTDDRHFDLTYHHIHFAWNDCEDNLISSSAGDTVHLVRRIYVESGTGKAEEIGRKAGLPSTSGLSDSCFVHLARTQTSDLVMRTNYFNGLLDFDNLVRIDCRGDINLNGISNEVADAELFARYLVCGDSVFIVNVEGQIQASDVNKDGAGLTLEDFIYLQRVIRDGKLPSAATYSKHLALFSHDSSTFEVSLKTGDSLAVAVLLFVGESVPALLDDNLEMVYGHDRSVTRVLIWPKMGHWIVAGPVLRSEGDLVHVDALTNLGGGIRPEVE